LRVTHSLDCISIDESSIDQSRHRFWWKVRSDVKDNLSSI
jgi:hypothetical protein